MQGRGVSVAMREKLQERLKRLAEQTSQTSQVPDACTEKKNQTTTSATSDSSAEPSASATEQRSSGSERDSKTAITQTSSSSESSLKISPSSDIESPRGSHHFRPPVQVLRDVESLRSSSSTKRGKSPKRGAQRERRPLDFNNSAKERSSKQQLPDWRASSRLRSHESVDRANETSLEKLNKLDKQLSLVLSRCGHQPKHHEPVMESEHAFIDESSVDDFSERLPDPAKAFPFELDEFQKRAILHIERKNCVFVAAHTSAGKTVVAEYAIALAAAGKTKVFYTSPIKTLSNQKFRDFRNTFEDVGLVTGDVSINEGAQCVIMTTEILRSMLYRGADVIRDVSYVVFDEVQFLNDEERGVVWEESIIMLPPHIGIIMLSATVPNALEFASWVGKTKETKVAVVSTNKRPVPLEHAILHPGASSDDLEASLLLSEGGRFLEDNYKAATTLLNAGSSSGEKKSRRKKKASKHTKKDGTNEEDIPFNQAIVDGANEAICSEIESGKTSNEESKALVSHTGGSRETPVKGTNKNKGPSSSAAKAAISGEGKGPGQGPNTRRSPWLPLIKFLEAKANTPTVVFCFSKKGCERAVESLEGSDLLPDAADKAHVHKRFESAIMRLREEDRNLPQVKRVFANLKTGISAHHAGLLPIVKEITEILFSEGFVKVLFATETFAMGVNMPARAVVFSGVRKNDGRQFRLLQAGEYTQMSGRAGRRGKDRVGNVYIFFPPREGIPYQRQMRLIMTGKPITLKSAFRLTYNMILNVLRVDELRVEEVMKRSFSEARDDANKESIDKALSMAGNTLDQTDEDQRSSDSAMEGTGRLDEYASCFSKMRKLQSELTSREVNVIFKEALEPGRLVIAEMEGSFLCLSVVFSAIPRYRNYSKQSRSSEADNVIDSGSQLWIACLRSVKPRHAEKHVKSVLLLPESIDPEYYDKRTYNDPWQVTSDGLVVVLAKIQASKIVYIFDEKYDLGAGKTSKQADAARLYHFSKKPYNVNRLLSENASYLQRVVREWKRKVIDDKQALYDAVSCEWSPQKSGSNSSRKQKSSNLTTTVLQKQETLAELCRRTITSASLYTTVVALSGRGLMLNVNKLIIQEKIRSSLNALKTVQEKSCEPRLLPEYQNRIAVLQRLDYVGSDGLNVQLKGRCGCEVLTADSLVLTEIVCENVLYDLEPAEVASLLSSLVCRKKNTAGIHDKDPEKYSEAYCAAKAKMRGVVENVGKVQEENNVELDFETPDGDGFECSVCRWDLAEAVFHWAKGEPFCNITDLTEQQEGDIVVCVKRLSELLKDAQSVAKGVGNTELVSVLEEAVSCIRRDVIFNGSLYYDEDLE